MFWTITRESAPDGFTPPAAMDGRFVMHRHRDADGIHLDLRIEQSDCLLGWRIDGDSLDGAPWAIEKPPHPLWWLDRDGDATREDAGAYCWLARNDNEKSILLKGRAASFVVRATRARGLPVGAIRAITLALGETKTKSADAAQLIRDGASARRRAVERFCGLGRELDGETFDASVWRKTLDTLSLDEIQAHLRAYEVRFDRAHPPSPVSRPETIADESRRSNAAMTILRS